MSRPDWMLADPVEASAPAASEAPTSTERPAWMLAEPVQTRPTRSLPETMVRGAFQGPTLDFADDAEALVRANPYGLGSALKTAAYVVNVGGLLPDTGQPTLGFGKFREEHKKTQAAYDESAEDHPFGYYGSQLVTGVAPALIPGVGGTGAAKTAATVGKLAKLAATAGKVGRTVETGVAFGAASGAGASRADLTGGDVAGFIGDVERSAQVGAIVSGGIGAVAPVLAKVPAAVKGVAAAYGSLPKPVQYAAETLLALHSHGASVPIKVVFKLLKDAFKKAGADVADGEVAALAERVAADAQAEVAQAAPAAERSAGAAPVAEGSSPAALGDDLPATLALTTPKPVTMAGQGSAAVAADIDRMAGGNRHLQALLQRAARGDFGAGKAEVNLANASTKVRAADVATAGGRPSNVAPAAETADADLLGVQGVKGASKRPPPASGPPAAAHPVADVMKRLSAAASSPADEAAVLKFFDDEARAAGVTNKVWDPTTRYTVDPSLQGLKAVFDPHSGTMKVHPDIHGHATRFAAGERDAEAIDGMYTLFHEHMHSLSPVKMDGYVDMGQFIEEAANDLAAMRLFLSRYKVHASAGHGEETQTMIEALHSVIPKGHAADLDEILRAAADHMRASSVAIKSPQHALSRFIEGIKVPTGKGVGLSVDVLRKRFRAALEERVDDMIANGYGKGRRAPSSASPAPAPTLATSSPVNRTFVDFLLKKRVGAIVNNRVPKGGGGQFASKGSEDKVAEVVRLRAQAEANAAIMAWGAQVSKAEAKRLMGVAQIAFGDPTPAAAARAYDTAERISPAAVRALNLAFSKLLRDE